MKRFIYEFIDDRAYGALARAATLGLAACLVTACSGRELVVGTNGGFGTQEVLAERLQVAPAVLRSDGSTLFWVDMVQDDVWSIPVTGGHPRSIASHVSTHRFLDVFGGEVFFIGAD